MNMIGKFGALIVDYQHPIQISLIALLILLMIIFLIRAGINAKKKKELLSQINKAVSEINTTVSGLSEKKTEVVYIDNRIPQPAVYRQTEETAQAKEEAEKPADTQACEVPKEPEKTEEPTAAKKFFDRDCAVSKNGRTYSIEELQNQIKE